MANTLFIDETYLKQNSPLSAQIDMAEIVPFVKTAEDIYITEAIGSSLSDYLKQAVIGDTTSSPPLSPQDIVVLDLIRNALVWYSTVDAIPFIWVKLRNVGLVKQSGDNMETLSETEMDRMVAECRTKAVWYINRLIAYLCANGSLYAAYNQGCWSCGDIAPANKLSNSIDLVFDDSIGETRETELLRKAGLIR